MNLAQVQKISTLHNHWFHLFAYLQATIFQRDNCVRFLQISNVTKNGQHPCKLYQNTIAYK